MSATKNVVRIDVATFQEPNEVVEQTRLVAKVIAPVVDEASLLGFHLFWFATFFLSYRNGILFGLL